MPKVCFLIPAGPNSEFFSQIAAFSAALSRLPWTRWEPSITVCLGDALDVDALQRWQPYLRDVALTLVPPSITERNTFYYGQIDSLYRWAPRDADVLVRMDADTLPVGDLEDVLDLVLTKACIAGVMAHFAFPRTPGLSARQSWHHVSQGLIDRPLDFRLSYSLVGEEAQPDDRDAPFYVNDGVVFLARDIFEEFSHHYLAIRPRLMDRLSSPYFAGQVGLTLAATQMGAATYALPMRYNFPNDVAATRRFPEELDDVRIFHYLRTDTFDRQDIFRDQSGYDRFIEAPMDGASAAFRQHVVRLLGKDYPFADHRTAVGAEPSRPRLGNDTLERYREALEANAHAVTADVELIDEALATASLGERRQVETRRAILLSGLFDRAFYLNQYKDIRNADVEPLQHYVAHGDREGRRPNAWFDPAYYRRRYMLRAGRTGNALHDYIEFGEKQLLQPCIGFDPASYMAAHPELAGHVNRPLFHFLHVGEDAGLPPPSPPIELEAAMRLAIQFGATNTLETLMRLKQELCSTLGPDEARQRYVDFALVPDSDRFERKVIGSMRDIARSSGSVYIELGPGGVPFTVPAPRVIGDAQTRELKHVSRAMFVACLEDVRVRGRSLVVEMADHALLDFEDWESKLFDCELDIDPSIFCVEGEYAWVPARGDCSSVIEVAEAYSLLGPQTGAFGDWMYTSLPRYVSADMSGHLPIVPVLIDEGLPATVVDSLRMMMRPGVEVIEVPPFRSVQVGRLWVSPSIHYAPAREIMDARYKFDYSTPAPSAFLPVVREICHRAAPRMGSNGTARIFLARKPSRWRKMVNHEEIESIAKAHGFSIVYPETLDFASQVALIQSAKWVVAPEGSAILLMYFARPGTHLCILNHPIIETAAYDGLLDEIDLCVLVGPIVDRDPAFPHRSSYRIEPSMFRSLLGDWLGETR